MERRVKTDWLVQSDGPYVVALDPELTAELRQEGMARELVNRIQRLRKDAGYDYTTRIELGIMGPPTIVAAAGTWGDFISGETLARGFSVGAAVEEADLEEAVDIDGDEVTIFLKRR